MKTTYMGKSKSFLAFSRPPDFASDAAKSASRVLGAALQTEPIHDIALVLQDYQSLIAACNSGDLSQMQ